MTVQEKRITVVHSIGGIFFGLLFFVIMFFGMFALMQNYIKVWEKPSRHFENIIKKEEIPLDRYINPILKNLEVEKNNIKIYLPGYNDDNTLIVAAPFVEKILLNSSTGERIKDENKKSTGLSSFLHDMHTGWQIYKNVGYTIFGLVAVASIFLIFIGIVQVFKIKYSNKGTSISKKSSKWHRKLSLWLFLPILIIFISGAALNLQVKGIKQLSLPLNYIISNGEETKWKDIIGQSLFPNSEIIKSSGIYQQMLPLEDLYKKARALNSNIDYAYLTLYRWEDANAQVKFTGYNSSYAFFNGYNNLPSITLSAVDGALLKEQKVFDAHWIRILFDFVNYLHFVPFWGFFMKFLLFAVLLVFTLATVFGIWLYLEKKAKSYDAKIPFYSWLSRLSMTVIIGVLPATALIFLLQWLLPFDMEERLIWQRGGFFLMWLFTGVIAFARLESYRASKDILYLAGVLFFLSPLIHWYISSWSPIALANSGLMNILGVDIALLILSFTCFIFALKLPKNRKEAKYLFKEI